MEKSKPAEPAPIGRLIPEVLADIKKRMDSSRDQDGQGCCVEEREELQVR